MPPRVGCPLKQALVTTVPEPWPSVSTLWTMILVKPDWIASAACRNILVSASSCEDGARLEVSSHGRLVSVSLAYVEVIGLWPEVTEVAHCIRNLKSACLFPSSQRNSFQFLVSLLLAATSCWLQIHVCSKLLLSSCSPRICPRQYPCVSHVEAEQWHKSLTYLLGIFGKGFLLRRGLKNVYQCLHNNDFTIGWDCILESS